LEERWKLDGGTSGHAWTLVTVCAVLEENEDKFCNCITLDSLESGSRSEPARLRRPRLASGTATRPSRKSTQYGNNYRASERGGTPPDERLRSTVRNDAQTSASDPGHATCQQDPIPAPTTSGRIGRKLTPFRVLRPAQKQGTNQKTRKRPRTERGGGRAAMGTSVRDGAPRRLTPAPAQSAVQTAFLFATIECAAPLVHSYRSLTSCFVVHGIAAEIAIMAPSKVKPPGQGSS